MNVSRPARLALLLVAAAALFALAGCGGAYGEAYLVGDSLGVPQGDVEADNQTDLSGTYENMYDFELAPAGTGLWTGNLLPDVVFPGEVAYVGTFDEDFYDAEADLDLGLVSFFDVYVQGGTTTTFEVF